MKFWILTIMSLTSVCMVSGSAFSKDFLNAAQKKYVLNRFDDASSDNIDEGECIANYKLIQCDDHAKACMVFFRFDDCGSRSNVTPRGVTYSCGIKNVNSLNSVLDIGFAQFLDCYQSSVLF